jgi:hypothetical protein
MIIHIINVHYENTSIQYIKRTIHNFPFAIIPWYRPKCSPYVNVFEMHERKIIF